MDFVCLWAVFLALAVLSMSISAATWKWPSQHTYPYCHQPPTCPCTLCQCFRSLTLPCTAGWSLLIKDLCGSFLGYQPCPQHHRDIYGLPSAPWAHPLCCRACVHLFQLSRSSFYVLEIVCIWFGSLGSPSMLQGLCVLLSSLDLLSAPQGLCVLQRFVCRASLDTLASPLPKGLLWASVGSLSLPFGQGYSLWAVYRLRSAAFSVFFFFCPLSPSFAWLSQILQLLFGSPCEGVAQCTGTLPVSQLPSSLGAQLPSKILHLFPFIVSILSLTLFPAA